MLGFPRDREPKKEFLLFKKPMPTEGIADSLLGVAFESRTKATLGRHAPQGYLNQKVIQNAEAKTTDQSKEPTGSGSLIASMGDWWRGGPRSAPEDEHTQAGASQGDESFQDVDNLAVPGEPHGEIFEYHSPCRWPKDLIDGGLYVGEPIVAVGVEASIKNARDNGMEVTILKAISLGLRISREEMDTVIVPVVRRWSMRDPSAKIESLLHNDDYRIRVIKLCEKQQREKKRVFIATNVISCEGLSYDRMKSAENESEADVKDPTNTLPAKLSVKSHHENRRTLKGEYRSEVVLCMSYRQLRYEHEKKNSGSWIASKRGHKQERSKLATAYFTRKDGSKDVFYLDNNETEGNCPAWLSHPDMLKEAESTGVFQDSELLDTGAGAEFSDDEGIDDFFDVSASDEE